MKNTFPVTAQEGIRWKAKIFLPRDIPKHTLGDRTEVLSPLLKAFLPLPLPSVSGVGLSVVGWRPSWLFLQDPTVATLGNTQKGQVLNEAAFAGAHVCTYATRLPGAAPSVSEGPAK